MVLREKLSEVARDISGKQTGSSDAARQYVGVREDADSALVLNE